MHYIKQSLTLNEANDPQVSLHSHFDFRVSIERDARSIREHNRESLAKLRAELLGT